MPATRADRPLPKNLYMETTSRCNLRCKGCIQYRGRWEAERDLTLAELIAITEQLPDLERTALHGIGEPLLNEALAGMIRHLKKRDVYVFFNSNGILLDEERQQELIDAGLDELRISLDGASPQGYRAIRNSDAFARILDNLHCFAKTLARCKGKRPKLALWFLGTRDNIDELPGVIRIAAEIGAPEVHLQRLVYFQDDAGYGVANRQRSLMDSTNKARELIERSQELAARLGVVINASGNSSPAASLQGMAVSEAPWRRCHRPETLTYVTANGNVLPCCISPFATIDYASIIMGNVFAAPLGEIWHGPRYEGFRQQRRTATPPACCRGCGLLWSL